jgi:hypothetical protein
MDAVLSIIIELIIVLSCNDLSPVKNDEKTI